MEHDCLRQNKAEPWYDRTRQTISVRDQTEVTQPLIQTQILQSLIQSKCKSLIFDAVQSKPEFTNLWFSPNPNLQSLFVSEPKSFNLWFSPNPNPFTTESVQTQISINQASDGRVGILRCSYIQTQILWSRYCPNPYPATPYIRCKDEDSSKWLAFEIKSDIGRSANLWYMSFSVSPPHCLILKKISENQISDIRFLELITNSSPRPREKSILLPLYPNLWSFSVSHFSSYSCWKHPT